MLKRFVAVILGILLAAGVFAGCHFVERDNKKDMRQVVATVLPVKDPVFKGGQTDPVDIYKFELMSAVYQQFSESAVPPTEEDVNNILDNLIERELMYIEIERQILKGNINWRDGEKEYDLNDLKYTVELFSFDPVLGKEVGREEIRFVTDKNGVNLYEAFRDYADANGKYRDFTDANKIKKAIYDTIDTELRGIQKSILSDFSFDAVEDSEQEPESSPQYPVRETETDKTEYPETTAWSPLNPEEVSRIPGKFGDHRKQSLERQALSQFVINIVKTVRDHNLFAINKSDVKDLKDDEEKFRQLINDGKYEELYLYLGQSFPIRFLTGKTMERQFKAEALQNYLIDRVDVTESDVAARYQSMLYSQQMQYGADPSAYGTALTNNETVLYRPNGDYMFVKHILVPFSEKQTAALTAFKARPNVTEADVIEFRDRLVGEIVAYPHPEGKELLDRPTSANAIFEEVTAAVSAKSASPAEAERLFDDFIYLYNTDPGAFEAKAGYSMNKNFDPNNRTYMKEFELAGEDFLKGTNPLTKEKYTPGAIYPHKVITDYGMHIMYFAADTAANTTLALRDYPTLAQYETIYEILEKEIRVSRENGQVDSWATARVNDIVREGNYKKVYGNRYKSIWKV